MSLSSAPGFSSKWLPSVPSACSAVFVRSELSSAGSSGGIDAASNGDTGCASSDGDSGISKMVVFCESLRRFGFCCT
eukprot:2104541-Amphidinium_carterae.1